MVDSRFDKKQLINEIINRRNLGDKKFHSDTSINGPFGEDNNVFREDSLVDPGVQNASINNNVHNEEDTQARRRTMSTPGPDSGGSLSTATASRAARRKVNYHPDVKQVMSVDRPSRSPAQSRLGDESGASTPIGDRNNTIPSYYNSNYRNGDSKSLNSYRLYPPSGTPYRKRSEVTMDAQSIRSLETQAPPPTSPEDNKKQTARYLTLIISTMYAVAIVTFGIVIYISDQFLEADISSIYTLILIFLGLFYHIYIILDINIYKNKAQTNQRNTCEYEEAIAEYLRKQEDEFGFPTPGTPEYKPHKIPPPTIMPLKHEYCFSRGRHSGSFFLKLGAAGFALGHLIHSVLKLVVQFNYLQDRNIDNDECIDYVQVVVDILNPLYCFLQLFFVFKFSNVIILKKQGLAHIAFMHIIGSCLCFWLSAIIRETVLALSIYAQSKYGNTTVDDSYNNTDGIGGSSGFLDLENLINENCVGSDAVYAIFQRYSPYLYPFSIEFNILIVAVYYIIWSNIGNCHNEDNSYSEIHNSSSDDSNSVCKNTTMSEENDFTSNFVIYADCHASNRGLFAGLIVIVGITGVLILGFVFSGVDRDLLDLGYLLNDSTKLALHSIMLICSIVAFIQTRKLDINGHPISLLDDILLFVCLPLFFMETALSLAATLTLWNLVTSFDYIIMLIQVLIQTLLIMDGLRRCSNSRKLRRMKPGRELIMFLIITNVAMWLFYTFSFKSPESVDKRYEFYGKELWTILGHVSLPLIMFYRFHSSVCFADIWDSAYKPGSEH